MATFYTDSNQRVGSPMMYLREHSSYPDTSLVPSSTMMLYMNNSSASFGSDTTTTTATTTLGNSQQQAPPPSSCIGGGMGSNFNGRGDPTTDHHHQNQMLQMMNHPSTIHLHNSGHGQGLSLTLGTQIPPVGGGFHMPSSPTCHSNMGLVSFLSPNPNPEETTRHNNLSSPRNENSRNIMEYVQGAGFNQDSSSSSLLLQQQQQGAAVRNIPNSRYLKAAQQLLEEVVNVRKALKQADEAVKDHQNKENSEDQAAKSSEDGGDAAAAAKELSHSEKQELQTKLTKLLTMLDEVDKRYKQYYHQMQFVVSSFDAVAGPGAAKPYTALALQRISRHFRCLRDAITGQIQSVRKSLGEQDSNSGGVGIARLRYVDQQLRQQRALQQLGMMQPHAWRPQRGLPETSVSILRAWLFEHFLHPYPKDSDKIMLARQTGLTRSQVSNWFINARVRLWKPMVEEMYKEEAGDAEMDSNSSSESALKALNKGEDMMMQKTSSSFENIITDPRSNHHNMMQQQQQHQGDIEMVGSSGGGGGSFQTRNIETEYNVKLSGEQESSVYESSRFMSDAETAFHMSELGGRFSNNATGVSLTLGLQHFEGSMHHHHHHHHGFVPIRGGDDEEFYSTVGGDGGRGEVTEYDVVNNNNNNGGGGGGGGTQQQQHHRLGPGQQLLHDFVA